MESSSTTTRQQRPVPLPEGWTEWIRDAVYFASSSCSYKGTVSGGEAISIYAINTKDELFPVYHIIDFLCGPETCKASEAACAVLGVRVYVVAGESTWYCDMRTGLWEKGLDLNGIIRKPILFTLRSYYLYVLDSLLVPQPSGYSFQVRVEPGWYSLEDPPSLFPANADFQSDCVIRGLSCVDNYKVILHVSSAQQGACDVSLTQHFLCFCITDECDGEWSTLQFNLSESCVPRASHFPDGLYPFYRSHLDDGEPLILPSLPGKLHALYLLISPPESESEMLGPELRLEYDQEVVVSCHDIDCEWPNKTMRTWNLFHVAGNNYCAIAFPHPDPNDYRDSFRGAFFIFSFNLAVPPVEEMEEDGHNASASFNKLTIKHVHKWFGAQCPLP